MVAKLDDYSVFVTLLRVLIVMGIPAVALQTVFAKQAAAAATEEARVQLVTTTRSILKAMLGLWLVSALLIFAAANPLCSLLRTNTAALWITILMVLTGLLTPIFKGLLQGQHHFLGLGWLQILYGVGRFSATCVIILLFEGHAAGAMLAALISQGATVAIAAWLTRDTWWHAVTAKFHWKNWIAEVLPLTIGIASVTLMSSIDMIFVQSIFPNQAQVKLYGGAMLTGFAIVQFIAPITSVMFTRIVHSVAHAEKTDTLGLTVAATAIFGAVAAIGGTILPELPLRIIFYNKPLMWDAAPLVPWFAWALVPLTVANVLILNILARSRFQALLWAILVPVLYAATLGFLAPTLVAMANPFTAFKTIVLTLGLYGLVLTAVTAWFSWRTPATASSADRATEPGHSASGTTSSPSAKKTASAS